MFGIGYVYIDPFNHSMDPGMYLAEIDVDSDRSVDFLDARDLPPPEPLQQTMNRLAELDDATVFIQLNDRVPKLLFPKLDDRGIDYETTETDEGVVTAMWRPSS
jgi:hypothetical protein